MLKKIAVYISMFILLILSCTTEADEETYTKSEVENLVDDAINDANKLVAYGVINLTGSIESGSGNFIVIHDNVGLFDIYVNGVEVRHTTHTITATPFSTNNYIAVWQTIYNIDHGYGIRIRTYDDAGSLSNLSFSFIILKN